jgi:hypothetical protein
METFYFIFAFLIDLTFLCQSQTLEGKFVLGAPWCVIIKMIRALA